MSKIIKEVLTLKKLYSSLTVNDKVLLYPHCDLCSVISEPSSVSMETGRLLMVTKLLSEMFRKPFYIPTKEKVRLSFVSICHYHLSLD